MGRKSQCPKTPSSTIHLEKYDLPEAIKEELVEQIEDKDEPMLGAGEESDAALPPHPIPSTEEDEAKLQLRFFMNEHLTERASNDKRLLRVYWDQGALLQAEWNVPVLANMRTLPLR